MQVSSTSYTPGVMTSPTSTSTSAANQTYTIETINPTSQTPGIAASSDVVAILPLSGTTVTAWQVTGTTGLAVVEGTTISFRDQGITLSNGEVVSLGFYGLEDSTSTAFYTTDTGLLASAAATASATGSSISTQTAGSGSSPTSTGTKTAVTSSVGSQSATSASGLASSTTSASGAQGLRGLCAGKAILLLGAVLGFVACCA